MTPVAMAITIGLLTILLTLLYLRYAKSGPTNLPPGPKPLPIIGNFHLLGPFPHRALAKLAQIYGPIMSIHLAQVPAIIISSPHAAKLVLKQYDAVCSDRPQIEAWLYGAKSMSFTPYGNHWRRVRMMCSQHILSASKIAEFEEVRAVETEAAMRKLEVAAAAREVVDVDEVVGELIEDIGMIMVVGSKGNGRYDVKSVISEAMNLAGQFNLADFIPYLGLFDFQYFILLYLFTAK